MREVCPTKPFANTTARERDIERPVRQGWVETGLGGNSVQGERARTRAAVNGSLELGMRGQVFGRCDLCVQRFAFGTGNPSFFWMRSHPMTIV